MNPKNELDTIHLNPFEFAQAKLELKIRKTMSFTCYRDDLFPFVKFFKEIDILPIKELKKFMPVVYWKDSSLIYGFITKTCDETVFISNLKEYPLEVEIHQKYILGRIKIKWPFPLYKLMLLWFLKKEKYKKLN